MAGHAAVGLNPLDKALRVSRYLLTLLLTLGQLATILPQDKRLAARRLEDGNEYIKDKVCFR
jgi:hypothetical protein